MWNPRFVAYARASGAASPEAALLRDAESFPGGKMAGFIVWTHERWRAWRKLRGRGQWDVLTDDDHRDFDRFIEA